MIYFNDKVDNKNYIGVLQHPVNIRSSIKNIDIKDSVSFSGKETNSNTSKTNKLIAGIISGAALIGGSVLLIKKGKVSDDASKSIKEGVERLAKKESNGPGAKVKSSNFSSYSKAPNSPKESSSVSANSRVKRNDPQYKKGEEQIIEANEIFDRATKQNQEVKKSIKENDLRRAKIEKDLDSIDEWIQHEQENLNKMEKEFKKFYADVKDAWEESEAKRSQYWKNFHAKYNFDGINSNSLKILKGKAEKGLETFRNFGKDPNGKPYEEISALDSIDGITVDSLKKAHRKLYKEYGPIMNTGTAEEKAEAIKIMQQINPANDNLRAYVEISKK